MKKLISLAAALALGFACTAMVTEKAETAPAPAIGNKASISAETAEADAPISPKLDRVLTELVDTSVENEKRLQKGEEPRQDTDDIFLNAALGAWEGAVPGKNEPVFTLVPTDEQGVSQLNVRYVDALGKPREIGMGIYFDHGSGECFSRERTKGVYRSGFNYNAYSKQIVAQKDAYQRVFGFTRLYDYLGALPLGYDYKTQRVIFEYGGKEYCMQLWKGNYHWKILVGGEIGLYCRRPGPHVSDFYRSAGDDDLMGMSMSIYDGKEEFISLSDPSTWWLTAFRLHEQGMDKDKAILEGHLVFKNAEMCRAFADAAKKNEANRVTVNGNSAHIIWQ